MQFFQVFPLLLMLVAVMSQREVNNGKEEDRSTDAYDLHDFFIDDEEIDEMPNITEIEGDREIPGNPDYFETENDSEGNEKPDIPEVELAGEGYNPGRDEHVGGKCTNEQLAHFPHRFREWLLIIMQALPPKSEEDGEPLLPIRETDDFHAGRKWVPAVQWKFCDLDVEPRDRHLSRRELIPLRSPLVSMEPCIDPFLDNCDANDDYRISPREWGRCFGLEDDEIKDDCRSFKIEK